MKQSQGLGLLRFARNDCKYFCPTTYQYRSVKPKNLGKDAKFRVSTGLKSVPKILN
ncbi:hypothetical protein [Nostoc sphaeroides]|uniref:Uncharacterized protein n=1 Tax=Nostoc sphaeroides CCNUC1 TaxID=2653204 RepID=A0A5P8VUC4_9NOSO|nr:hypothetical protein [Nostoc sphaeroides]QFS44003.1 hypothetical protein GXM_01476 [Nostoc sphaeroides CCNUC1]